MLVSLIVAMDLKRGIGFKGRVPWRLSSDMRRFKALTWSHHVVMGRKTHESIGRALPGRVNLVISRNQSYKAPGCVLVSSLELALNHANLASETEAFIIGGAEIYHQSLFLAHRIYLTQVHTVVPADVFFPPIDFSEWKTITQEEILASDIDQFAYTYSLMERIG